MLNQGHNASVISNAHPIVTVETQPFVSANKGFVFSQAMVLWILTVPQLHRKQ